jgi:4-nitrophenyl phosphatase
MTGAQEIKRIIHAKCFLLDMDGTIYLGERLLLGAKELVEYFVEKEIPFFFLTNNSSRSQGDYVKKLGTLGLDVPVERILTSGEATAVYLKRQHPSASIFLVGTPSLEDEFDHHGLDLVAEDPAVVVLGFDTSLTYEKLRKLCQFAAAGKPYVATHPDINCPTPDGFIPDIGAVIALVETSTGRTPDVIIGKPNRPMVDAALQKTGLSAGEVVMVGDRLYTDIAMGQSGIGTVLVLSGETKRKDLESSPYRPDLVVEHVGELLEILKTEK